MTHRTLSLKREPLTELSGDDLAAVVGGEPPVSPSLDPGCDDGFTTPPAYCLTFAGSRCIY